MKINFAWLFAIAAVATLGIVVVLAAGRFPAIEFRFPSPTPTATQTPTPTLLYSTFEPIGPIDPCGSVSGSAGLHKNATLEAIFRAKPCPADKEPSATEASTSISSLLCNPGQVVDIGLTADGTPLTKICPPSGFIDLPSPTPEVSFLTVAQDFPCYLGPGSQYGTVNTLTAGTQLQIVGYGFGGGWLVGLHPTLQGIHCWIAESFVSLTIPVDHLRLISIPPEPSSTPRPTREAKPTSCYKQGNKLVCQ